MAMISPGLMNVRNDGFMAEKVGKEAGRESPLHLKKTKRDKITRIGPFLFSREIPLTSVLRTVEKQTASYSYTTVQAAM